VQEKASSLGLKSILLSASDDDELAAGFASAKQQGAGAMLVASDPFFNSRSGRFITLAAQYSIPTIYPQGEYVRGGGLISYGPDFADGYRNSGLYVGKILKGAKAAELPVVQPVKFELVINLKTAKTLGIDVPPTLLATANGQYVGRVLKGEKSATLPVFQATKFEFVINLKTAKTLGLEVSPTVSARADDIIE